MSEQSLKIEKLVAHELGFPGAATLDDLKRLLAQKLNELIESDFSQLVQLLYKIDIDEARLRSLLKQNAGNDTGYLLAELIIERQFQKIKSRLENKQDENINEDEKW